MTIMTYRQALHDQIMGLIASGIDAQAIDRPGGIFVRPAQQISQVLSDAKNEPTTNWPGRIMVTAAPTSSTMPTDRARRSEHLGCW